MFINTLNSPIFFANVQYSVLSYSMYHNFAAFGKDTVFIGLSMHFSQFFE